jgi:tol-pal system protein YbgF
MELKVSGKASSAPAFSSSTSKYSATTKSAKPVKSRGPSGSSPGATRKVSPRTYSPPTPDERTAYRQAFKLLSENKYSHAIRAFKSFLQRFPNGGYTDNAQYWLGESYFASRKFKAAITEFNKVVTNFPNSPKVAGAKVKMGFCYYELKQYRTARKVFEEVIKSYPRHSSARLAKSKLRDMGNAGR